MKTHSHSFKIFSGLNPLGVINGSSKLTKQHDHGALNDMLAVFGKNKLKQGLFIARYILKVNLLPFLRRFFGPLPEQKIFR